MNQRPTAGGRSSSARGSAGAELSASGRPRARPAPRKDGEPTQTAKLIHDLNGSLATIGLRLQMISGEQLTGPIAEHIQESLRALQQSRAQLVQLAEMLAKNERQQGKRRRSP